MSGRPPNDQLPTSAACCVCSAGVDVPDLSIAPHVNEMGHLKEWPRLLLFSVATTAGDVDAHDDGRDADDGHRNYVNDDDHDDDHDDHQEGHDADNDELDGGA